MLNLVPNANKLVVGLVVTLTDVEFATDGALVFGTSKLSLVLSTGTAIPKLTAGLDPTGDTLVFNSTVLFDAFANKFVLL